MYKEVDGDMKFSAKEIDNRIRLLKRELVELQEGGHVLQAHNVVVTAAKQAIANETINKLNTLQNILNQEYEYLYTKEEK